MPKRSNYGIAVGLHGQPGPATNSDAGRPNTAFERRNAPDLFYFQLEAFLDYWRREGIAEDVVRAALERANQTSLQWKASLIGSRVGDRSAGCENPTLGRPRHTWVRVSSCLMA